MTFGTVFSIILFGYLCYYGGMIAYDQYRKDDVPIEAKVDEEEIDITDEASEFQPVRVVKTIGDRKPTTEEEREEAIMSGRIEVDELIPKVDELAEKGEEAWLAQVTDEWQEVAEAA